jgi:hypothetical protein
MLRTQRGEGGGGDFRDGSVNQTAHKVEDRGRMIDPCFSDDEDRYRRRTLSSNGRRRSLGRVVDGARRFHGRGQSRFSM